MNTQERSYSTVIAALTSEIETLDRAKRELYRRISEESLEKSAAVRVNLAHQLRSTKYSYMTEVRNDIAAARSLVREGVAAAVIEQAVKVDHATANVDYLDVKFDGRDRFMSLHEYKSGILWVAENIMSGQTNFQYADWLHNISLRLDRPADVSVSTRDGSVSIKRQGKTLDFYSFMGIYVAYSILQGAPILTGNRITAPDSLYLCAEMLNLVDSTYAVERTYYKVNYTDAYSAYINRPHDPVEPKMSKSEETDLAIGSLNASLLAQNARIDSVEKKSAARYAEIKKQNNYFVLAIGVVFILMIILEIIDRT